MAKWMHHISAWVDSGTTFLDEAINQPAQLEGMFEAMEEFMSFYSEIDWTTETVEDCKKICSVFERHALHEHLVQITSHIYKVQQKGFEARHAISIASLGKALERNRKILEEFPQTNPTSDEKMMFSKFYDDEKRYKCTRITCRYFSEGFKDETARKRHVNLHNRPFQCEVNDCLGAEGFTNVKDLEKHVRAYHPERSDLAERFKTATIKPGKTTHTCTQCGRVFTRNFHRKNHELSHRGERPHECAECGKAFTRLNDLKRHQKIHERK